MGLIFSKIVGLLKLKKPSKIEERIIYDWHHKYNKFHFKRISRLQALTVIFVTLLMTLSFLISWYMTMAIYLSILVFLYLANLVFSIYISVLKYEKGKLTKKESKLFEF